MSGSDADMEGFQKRLAALQEDDDAMSRKKARNTALDVFVRNKRLAALAQDAEVPVTPPDLLQQTEEFGPSPVTPPELLLQQSQTAAAAEEVFEVESEPEDQNQQDHGSRWHDAVSEATAAEWQAMGWWVPQGESQLHGSGSGSSSAVAVAEPKQQPQQVHGRWKFVPPPPCAPPPPPPKLGAARALVADFRSRGRSHHFAGCWGNCQVCPLACDRPMDGHFNCKCRWHLK